MGLIDSGTDLGTHWPSAVVLLWSFTQEPVFRGVEACGILGGPGGSHLGNVLSSGVVYLASGFEVFHTYWTSSIYEAKPGPLTLPWFACETTPYPKD